MMWPSCRQGVIAVWCVYVLGVNCGGTEFCVDHESMMEEDDWMDEDDDG